MSEVQTEKKRRQYVAIPSVYADKLPFRRVKGVIASVETFITVA